MLDKRYASRSSPRNRSVVVILIIAGCFSMWLLGAPTRPSLKLSQAKEDSTTHPPGQFYGIQQLIQQNPYMLGDELPTNDESTLIDVDNFRFTINHNPCNNAAPLLLVLVHSAPGNFPKRDVIRETWGKSQKNNNTNIIVLFMIGSSEKYHSQLLQENEKYEDIIQGNFLDAYRNMTYKHVMALKWATYYCSSAKYVLKVDDDVFIHIPAIFDFLRHGLSPFGTRRLILCNPMNSAKVQRARSSKWCVTPLEYSGQVYPTYCPGWAILYSPDSVFMLYREAQKEPFFWVDDVHITGTIARKLNLTHGSLRSLILTGQSMHQLLENPDKQTNKQKFIFGPPNLTGSNIRALHKLIVSNKTIMYS